MTDESIAAEPMCMCKDRSLDKCPGEWEPGCDLGNNEKFVRVGRASPEVLRASTGSLSEEEERAAFEKWVRGHRNVGVIVDPVDMFPACWEGWKARAALSPSGPMISLNAVAAEEWRGKLAEQCGKTLALQTVAAKLIAAFDKPSTYAPLSDAIESVRAALANTQGTEP